MFYGCKGARWEDKHEKVEYIYTHPYGFLIDEAFSMERKRKNIYLLRDYLWNFKDTGQGSSRPKEDKQSGLAQ